MTGPSGDDAVDPPMVSRELNYLRNRIGLQSEQLSKHARELTQLRVELDRLDERINAHQRGDIPPSPTAPPTQVYTSADYAHPFWPQASHNYSA